MSKNYLQCLRRTMSFFHGKSASAFLAGIALSATTAQAQNTDIFRTNQKPGTISISGFNEVVKTTASIDVTVNVNAYDTITGISDFMFGNNTNMWMGQMVSEPDLMEHLTKLNPRLLRAPGGSTSDIYFWNALPGQKPLDVPDTLLDADGKKVKQDYWSGKNSASWTLSLDNYYKMLKTTGSEGSIVVNYGYARYGTSADPVAAAAHLAADWVRYDKGRTRFWEIGNENPYSWEAGYRIDVSKNKDGQPELLTGALYGKHFKVFADSMKSAAKEIGATIFIGAYLVERVAGSWETASVKTWNSGVVPLVDEVADFYIVHNYYTPYNTNSTASQVLNTATTVTHDMMSFVAQSIKASGGKPKPIALTEYNIFAKGSKQMVSHINGMHAAITVSEAIKNKFGAALRWDLSNSYENGDDMGMFSNGDEPGVPKWNPRPDFYHLYFLKKYTGNYMVGTTVSGSSDVLSYASLFQSGHTGVALFNKGLTQKTVKITVQNREAGDRYFWYTINGSDDSGEFSSKVIINNTEPDNETGGPLNYAELKPNSAITDEDIRVTLPARSAVYLLTGKSSTLGTAMMQSNENMVEVLNNPSADGSFSIKMNGYKQGEKFDLQIMDAKGQLLYTDKFSNAQQININPKLCAGAYYIHLKSVGGMVSKKLIVY